MPRRARRLGPLITSILAWAMVLGLAGVLGFNPLAATDAAPPTVGGTQVFPSNNVWNRIVTDLPVHAKSADYLNSIGLNCHLPNGAFYAFPSIRSTKLSSKDFALKLLETQKVACVPGSAFGPSGEGFVRCSYATAMADIEKAMERMARFVKSH